MLLGHRPTNNANKIYGVQTMQKLARFCLKKALVIKLDPQRFGKIDASVLMMKKKQHKLFAKCTVLWIIDQFYSYFFIFSSSF